MKFNFVLLPIWIISLKLYCISSLLSLSILYHTVYHNILLIEKFVHYYIFLLIVQKGNRNKWSYSLKMTRIPQCLMPGLALLSHLLVNMPFVFGVLYFSLTKEYRRSNMVYNARSSGFGCINRKVAFYPQFSAALGKTLGHRT